MYGELGWKSALAISIVTSVPNKVIVAKLTTLTWVIWVRLLLDDRVDIAVGSSSIDLNHFLSLKMGVVKPES